MDLIKLLLLENRSDIKNELEDILLNIEYIQLIGIATNEKEAAEFIENSAIDVLLINHCVSPEGYEITERFSSNYPDVAIIVLEDTLHEDMIHKAFFSGARDVILKPINPSKLIDSIFKINQHSKKRELLHREIGLRNGKKSKTGKIISIFSAKGGTGKTFVATNMAVILAKKYKEKRVVVVDLNLEYGNVALALNVTPKYSLTDIIDDIRNIDQDTIESYLTSHESGLWVLPASTDSSLNEFIIPEHVEIILKILKNSFDFIIVDTIGRLQDSVYPVFKEAEHMVMVITPEITSLKNNKKALITLNQMNYPKSKIKIVMNKISKNEIKLKDIGASLTSNIFETLSTDYKNAISSMNIGIPIASSQSVSRLKKDLYRLTDKLLNS
jgi:Flp pilus assembly protein, ATPase CpaE